MTRDRRLGWLLGVVLVCAVAGALSGAASAGTVGATANDSVAFAGGGVVEATAGETATITVVEPTGANASTTVAIGSPDVGFLAEARVADRDGDGTVSLRVDTAAAGNGNASSYVSVGGGDALRHAVQRTNESAGGLAPGTYGLTASADGHGSAVGSLVLSEPATNDSDTTTPVNDTTAFNDTDAGTSVNDTTASNDSDAGTSVNDTEDSVISNDTDATTPVNDTNTSNEIPAGPTLDGWAHFEEGEYVNVTRGERVNITFTDPTPPGQTTRFVVGTREGAFVAAAHADDRDGDGAVTLTLDTARAGNGNASRYLTVGAGDALRNATQRTPARSWALNATKYRLAVGREPGDFEHFTTLVVEPRPETPADDTPANRTGETGSTAHANVGDDLQLTATASAAIEGETTLPANATVHVQVRSVDPRSPFLRSTSATVAANGSFLATVDLSNVPHNTSAAVRVRHANGSTLDRANATIVRCAANCSGPAAWPAFGAGVVNGTAGETVAFPVEIPENRRGVNLTVGDADDGFAVDATAIDRDGDGRVVLVLDTARAGNGNASSYLTARGEDAVPIARQTVGANATGLDAGNYDLAMGPDSAPYDVGTLVLAPAAGPDGGDEERPTGPAAGVNATGEVSFITAGDGLAVAAGADQRIYGETALAANRTVTVWVRSPEAGIIQRTNATVTRFGTFNATVDLGEAPVNASLRVVATRDGEVLGATAARTVPCSGNCSQSAATAGNASAARAPSAERASNVIVVADREESIPAGGAGAVGVGGLLSVLGVARLTGVLRR